MADERYATTRTRPLDFRRKRDRDLRVQVMIRDDFTCQECGWRPPDVPDDYDGRFTVGVIWDRVLHLDHLVARAHGGPNAADNLRVLCEPCNCSRGVG